MGETVCAFTCQTFRIKIGNYQNEDLIPMVSGTDYMLLIVKGFDKGSNANLSLLSTRKIKSKGIIFGNCNRK